MARTINQLSSKERSRLTRAIRTWRPIITNTPCELVVLDEPGVGGACHRYRFSSRYDDSQGRPCTREQVIQFQHGPRHEPDSEAGLFNEDLLITVVDRLIAFQAGKYACAENAEALEHIQVAIAALERRTAARRDRGVLGTHKV